MGSNHPPYRRRPRKMHATLNLAGALWWIEKFFGIPQESIQFVLGADNRVIPAEELHLTNVKDLQMSLDQYGSNHAPNNRKET